MRYTVLTILFLSWILSISAQNNCENQLGVWLWRLEQTGLNHSALAFNLQARDIKRIYVKVADGTADSLAWDELVDVSLVEEYKEQGISPWGWSYNYPTSDFELQAEALYQAAKTGYEGFVVDVEMEFDGDAFSLNELFSEFFAAKQRAIADGHATRDFQLYCTTWGNPKDHNFSIATINPYVDGFMPQTYVELWGQSFVDNLRFWIEEGNREYSELGATKPIHHIASTATDRMTTERIDEFMRISGPETSLWRIPGSSVPFTLWERWNEVDWDREFCDVTSTAEISANPITSLYPNPTDGLVYFSDGKPHSIVILDTYGRLIFWAEDPINSIDLSTYDNGLYLLYLDYGREPIKVVKQ